MKLSVVIPVYNGADFINKSYNSIINQNIKDFEILYVDNNSTDDSVKEIESLKEKDSRVKLLFQPKQGAAPARNMGINNASGGYVYVFDVDDEIYPKALQNMINVLDQNDGVDAVFGKMVKSTKSIAETQKPLDETFEVIIKEKPYWGLYWFSSLKLVVGPPAFLYRKSVFKKIGLYNEAIKNNEDTALDIALGMLCNIAFLDMYVYLYFKHETSTIQTAKRKMNRAFMLWPRMVKEHLAFYFKHQVPLEFKKLLFGQIYNAMGKQIFHTKGIKNRLIKRKELVNDIKPIKFPWKLNLGLYLLVLMPIKILMKFYNYYLVPTVLKKQLKNL